MRDRLKTLLPPALLVALAFAVLVSLGNWQVRRLAWKEDLIARAAERPTAAPIDLRDVRLPEEGPSDAFLGEYEYRPVRLNGEYVRDGEVLVFTSLNRPRGPYGGPGYWVMTPFATSGSGAIVLVNRGFVPDGRQDDYSGAPDGEQTLTGLIRAAERGSVFTPEPKLEEGIYFARNPERIAGTTDPAEMLGSFFVDLGADATPPSGLPQAGETRMSFASNHLQYAITWYGLAAALLAVFAVFIRRRLKEPQAETGGSA